MFKTVRGTKTQKSSFLGDERLLNSSFNSEKRTLVKSNLGVLLKRVDKYIT